MTASRIITATALGALFAFWLVIGHAIVTMPKSAPGDEPERKPGKQRPNIEHCFDKKETRTLWNCIRNYNV